MLLWNRQRGLIDPWEFVFLSFIYALFCMHYLIDLTFHERPLVHTSKYQVVISKENEHCFVCTVWLIKAPYITITFILDTVYYITMNCHYFIIPICDFKRKGTWEFCSLLGICDTMYESRILPKFLLFFYALD